MKNVVGLILLIGLLAVGWMRRDELNGLWATYGAHLGASPSPTDSGSGQPAATPHPAREAQARATALYPALTVPNSPLNRQFISLYQEAQAKNPALLARPDWPLKLAERAAGSGSAVAAARPAKQVVIYTTWDCPYCKQAKQYFAKKGIRYQEYDIDRSTVGKEEYRKLGGNGVPLIMVGNKKIQGFSASELDRMLF